MRILLVSQNFYPENFKSNDIAFDLARRGHDVSVLAAIPNYPEGVYYKGYGVFKRRVETVDGVKIYRALLSPRGKKPTSKSLSLNYLTYAFFATMWVLFFFAWKRKFDAIIVHQTSPITQAIPAVVLGMLRKTKVYTWVLDIWPDSAMSRFSSRKGAAWRILNSITNWVYRNSYKILISSKPFTELVNRDADYTDKIVYFPNWCDDVLKMPMVEVPELPKGFVVMMAGNLGNGIGAESVVELVEKLKDTPEVKFVFVGGGSKTEEMKAAFDSKGLTNAYMLGRVPFEMIPALYSAADAMLLTLRKTDLPHLTATVPARVQSYMAAGKPILGMIDGGAAELISEMECGYCSAAGDADALAEYIKDIAQNGQDTLRKMGENGRSAYERYFVKDMCIENLENILNN